MFATLSRKTSFVFTEARVFCLSFGKMALVLNKTAFYALLAFEYFCLTVRGVQVSQVKFVLRKLFKTKLTKGKVAEPQSVNQFCDWGFAKCSLFMFLFEK